MLHGCFVCWFVFDEFSHTFSFAGRDITLWHGRALASSWVARGHQGPRTFYGVELAAKSSTLAIDLLRQQATTSVSLIRSHGLQLADADYLHV